MAHIESEFGTTTTRLATVCVPINLHSLAIVMLMVPQEEEEREWRGKR